MLLPLYTLTLIQKYTCIILSLLLYIYIHIYIWTDVVQTLICFYLWEPSHLEPLCIRYIYPQVYIYRMTDTFVYELKLCEITCVSALPVYTLKLFVYKHILTSVYIYIYRYSCTWTHAVQTHICVCPLRVLRQWTFLYTSTFSEVYIYHIIDSFVYEPMLCKLKYVCDLASAHT